MNADTLCHSCGNTIKFIDIVSKTESSFLSEGSGLRAIATNPFQSVIAVAEEGLKPRIFVYRYPSLEQVCVLTGV